MGKIRLLYGEEEYLLREEVARATAGIPVAARAFNLSVFHAEESDPAEVVEALRTPAFGGGERLVVLQRVDAWTTGKLETLGKALERGLPGVTFLLTAYKIDKRLKFYQSLAKLGEVREYKRLDERETAAWLRQRAQAAYGRKLEEEAAALLVEFNGTELALLDQELAKLDQYLGSESRPIGREDVLAVGSNTATGNIFAFVDALGRRQAPQALLLLRRLLLDRQPPFQIMGMVTRQLQLLGHLKALAAAEGISPRLQTLPREKQGDLARTLGVAPYFLNNYWQQTRRFRSEELTTALGRAALADTRLKLGRGPEELELLTLAICGGEGAKEK